MVGIARACDGELVRQFRYSPYGELTAVEDGTGATASNAGTWHLFQGLWRDHDTGLDHARNRDYASWLGRLIQADPNQTGLIVANALAMNGQTQAAFASMSAGGQYVYGLNLYQAFSSNPLNHVDPSGRFPITQQVVKTSLSAGLIGMVLGSLGGAIGDALFNPASSSTSHGPAAKVGGIGGAAGGIGGGMATAWVGATSLAALMTVAAVEGGIDGGIQSAMNGDSWGWILANAASSAAISGLGAEAIGEMLRMWRGAADDLAEGALETLDGVRKTEKALAGESAVRATMIRAGYSELPAKLPGDRGFDGVFVKFNPDGNLEDIIISESKFRSSGNAQLTETITMGTQLSEEWIDANIRFMRKSADVAVRQTGDFLIQNKGFIRTKFNVLGPDGINRWQPH